MNEAQESNLTPEQIDRLARQLAEQKRGVVKPEFIPGDTYVKIPSQKDVDENGAVLPEQMRPAEEKAIELMPQLAEWVKVTGEKLKTSEIIMYQIMHRMAADPDYIVGPPFRFRSGPLKIKLQNANVPREALAQLDDDTVLEYTKQYLEIFGADTPWHKSLKAAQKALKEVAPE